VYVNFCLLYFFILGVCPAGKSITASMISLNYEHILAECSNQGKCNRTSGSCSCYHPFSGPACSQCKNVNIIIIPFNFMFLFCIFKVTCPSSVSGLECSGHGICQNMAQLSSIWNSHHIYGSSELSRSSIAWDYNTMRGCWCNSSWAVGFDTDEYQLSEYYLPDCSKSKYFSCYAVIFVMYNTFVY
jgi:hypothetical protein